MIFMEMYDVKFKKKFGQNFIKDKRIVQRIVKVAEIGDNSLVIEVGPGGAILTKELANVSKNVLAYEIDRDLSNELFLKLKDYSNVDVLFQDFLQANLKEDISRYDFQDLFFVSNVPYYITTPILFKLIDSNLNFKKIVMMVQKEVGDRFTTKPGNRGFGAITVLLNYYFYIKKEFFVSKREFVPVPKVDSVVVSFTEKKDKLEVKDFVFFENLVKNSFRFKRKTIRNNFIGCGYDLNIIEDVLKEYGYDLNVRAEMLSVDIFVKIANELMK